MGYTPLISKIIISFIISSTVLYRYGNWFRQRISVTLVVILAWYCSFLIIFALPLDVISTVYGPCHQKIFNNTHAENTTLDGKCEEPAGYLPEKTFHNLWRTVYWSTQFLTWLIMPMMQSYIKAGEFSVKGKLKSALIDNAIYYGSYLLICGILLIYLALKGISLDWPKLKAIASSASNTWGLFLLVLLFGYALVEVPRKLWNKSNHSLTLTESYFKVAKISCSKCEAEENVDDVLESLHAVSLILKPGHYLYQNLETILQKVPAELKDRMHRRPLPDDSSIDIPSEKVLVKLHKQTIKSLQVLQREETQWHITVEKIFELEDILKNQVASDKKFKRTFERPHTWFNRYVYTPTVEWYWKCVLYCYSQKTLAVIAGILSICVIWSEVTFFSVTPTLSIFAVIVNIAKENYDYFSIELISTIIILYLCYCAYSTVLKIKLLNLYYLAPHHQTNEYSLIFSGMMLSRLTPPLCLNFLGLIHMDSHLIGSEIKETSYTQIMGHMDVISIISKGFNIYFPMAILILCLTTYFSLGSRFLSMIGFHQFIGDDEITTDLVEEGRELIKRERRKRQRQESSINRGRQFYERYQGSSRYKEYANGANRQEIDLDTSYPEFSDSKQTISQKNISYTDEVDTGFPLDQDTIDERFGVSTGLGSSRNSDYTFSTNYQSTSNYNTRAGVPRGIFDDV